MREYSSYAIMHELNNREFRKKCALFPEELRYYVILANSIIGTENAKRLAGTPHAVIKDGEEFVGKLLSMVDAVQDETFKEVLETYLIESMKGELFCSCPNCSNFEKCLDIDNLRVGEFFKRRVDGEETEEIKKEISRQIEEALLRTPHLEADSAHQLCRDFRHHYQVTGIGEVFGRYADIASALQGIYGIGYRKIQETMIRLNMEFCEKTKAGGER